MLFSVISKKKIGIFSFINQCFRPLRGPPVQNPGRPSYKTEVIEKRAVWEGADEVEYSTLVWVDWFNNKRIHTAIDDKSPAQFEMRYYQNGEAGYAA